MAEGGDDTQTLRHTDTLAQVRIYVLQRFSRIQNLKFGKKEYDSPGIHEIGSTYSALTSEGIGKSSFVTNGLFNRVKK